MNRAADQTFTVNGQVVVRRIGEDSLLVPIRGAAAGGRVFPLNETALAIWRRLAAGDTPRAAARRLCEEFDTTLPEALSDCEACARAFVAEGLLREGSPSR